MSWLLVNKTMYEEMKRKLIEYESEDPLIKMRKVVEVLDAGHLDKDSGDYQQTIHRIALELLSKYSKISDLYSKSTFIKDAGMEVLDKMQEMRQGSLSKQIEDKRSKKK